MKDPAIIEELERRRAEIQERTNYSVEKAMKELETAMGIAEGKKDAAALARCIELKSKLAGLLVERRQQAEIVRVELVQFTPEPEPEPEGDDVPQAGKPWPSH